MGDDQSYTITWGGAVAPVFPARLVLTFEHSGVAQRLVQVGKSSFVLECVDRDALGGEKWARYLDDAEAFQALAAELARRVS